MLSASSMNIGNSNIGVHGVEDLGGGWKTGFDIETALDLRDGSPRGSGGGFWGRRANMWVSGPAGSLRLGRSYNLATWGMWVWELTGEATYAVTPGTFGYLDSFTARSNSLITYVTPRLGDFQAGREQRRAAILGLAAERPLPVGLCRDARPADIKVEG